MTTNANLAPIEPGLRSASRVVLADWPRQIVFLLSLQWIGFGASWALTYALSRPIDLFAMFAALAAVHLATLGSAILSVFPRGNDWMPHRLYLATGVRSGLPLVVAVCMEYFLYPDFLQHGLLTLLILYLVSLVSGVCFSIHRLNACSA